MNENIIIVDFGSQVTKLIARRVRDFGVFSQIIPFQNLTEKTLKNMGYSNIANIRQGKHFEIEINESV